MRQFIERLGRSAALLGMLSGAGEAGAEPKKPTPESTTTSNEMKVVMPGDYAQLTVKEKRAMAQGTLQTFDAFFGTTASVAWGTKLESEQDGLTREVFEYMRFATNATKGSVKNFDKLLDEAGEKAFMKRYTTLGQNGVTLRTYQELGTLLKTIKDPNKKKIFFDNVTIFMRHLGAEPQIAAQIPPAQLVPRPHADEVAPQPVVQPAVEAVPQQPVLPERLSASTTPDAGGVGDGGKGAPEVVDRKVTLLPPEKAPVPQDYGRFVNRADARERAFPGSFFIRGNVREREGKPTIALTFDDGPDNTYTPQILDILKAQGVHATFYLQGGFLTPQHRSVIQRIIDEGHEIGLHSLDHSDIKHDPKKKQFPAETYHRQVEETERRLAVLTVSETNPAGYTTNLYRPAYGSITREQIDYFASKGKKIINWSIDTEDWGSKQTPEFMSALVSQAAIGGDIALMHSGGGNRSRTVASLPTMIERLKARGFVFMTTTEIIAKPVATPKKPASPTTP